MEKTFSAGPCQDPRHAYIYSGALARDSPELLLALRSSEQAPPSNILLSLFLKNENSEHDSSLFYIQGVSKVDRKISIRYPPYSAL